MQIKKMVTPDDKKVRRYTMPMDLTPTQEEPRMRTQAEIQAETVQRAEELAVRDGFQGPGKFAMKHYTLALGERSSQERELERGFVPVGADEGQAAAASRHLAKEITRHEQKGYSRDEAVELAKDDERRSGLHQTRANLPTGSPWAVAGEKEQQDAARHFSLMTGQRRGDVIEKRYAGPGPLSTAHEENRRTSRTELVKREAVSCLRRNIAQPDGQERHRIDEWFADNFPTPRPTSGGGSAADVAAHNALREQTIEAIMEDVRRILRDPAARAALGAVVG